jgi:hypothetical protein
MKIKLPKSIKEMTVKHLAAFADRFNKNMTTTERAKLFSELTGVPFEDAKRVDIDQINYTLAHYGNEIRLHIYTNPPKKLVVQGKAFRFIGAIGKMPVSWHIDREAFSEQRGSEVVAAFCYIEDGMEYCQMDKHGNVLNPLQPRIDLFREHLPADVALNLDFFFGRMWRNYKNAYKEIKHQRLMALAMETKSTIGKRRLKSLPMN